MLESEAGRAHIKGIIDKYLLEADINPYEKDTARLVEATSKAMQEILREIHQVGAR